MPVWPAASSMISSGKFAAVPSSFPCWVHTWAENIFYLLYTNKAMGLQRHFMPVSHFLLRCRCVSSLQPIHLFCLWPFSRFPWYLQPEVIRIRVLSHMQHSKHFQNGSNCRLKNYIFDGENLFDNLSHILCMFLYLEGWIISNTPLTGYGFFFGLQHWIRTIFRQEML